MIMKSDLVSRRRFMAGLGAAAAATGSAFASERADKARVPFRYCLNTSTIRGQNLSLDKEIEIAAKAGYSAIEPWVGKINDYVAKGGNLKDIRKQLGDLDLTVESAIDFSRWIVDDDAARAKGFEQVKRGSI
jgi:sugar phosphate isomerase/epimerase